MILVFDLDDTLYPEITFVESGFRAVAKYLHTTYRVSAEDSMGVMLAELEANGRGKVFDRALEKWNLSTKERLGQCLQVYRSHKPDISLFDDARKVLTQCKNRAKYLVTDGNKHVQHNKVTALDLYHEFNKVFITRRYGIDREKPNPYCFLKICDLEKVKPEDVVYIGDNPKKDFVEIKKLGFKTVRVRRGMFKDYRLTAEYEADKLVESLTEIDFEKL
ncbi:HAD family hydrolase [Chitinophaga sp. Ak27]|uniref:HAD family hydrolase n=1 Tax=Chitinophaga sp. Ak27 TaxID=2726116 RepID=UPI00145EF71A|nr:HAD-IA family hydrolase [Chitinophaga sp. Ak27]NLU94402.1 HAD-IA family hydrolase [Chitinophaga sp. Ak27]